MQNNTVVSSMLVLIFFNVTLAFANEGNDKTVFQNKLGGYVLGSGDVITIQVPEADEIPSKPIWIDTDGLINLPLAGRLKAAGLTIRELESQLNERLKAFVKDPHVVVAVTEFKGQPVSVLGFVTNPGVHQLQGRKTLLEVLSLAGGIRTEAGAVIRITRRIEYGELPLPGAALDASGQFSFAHVNIRSMMDGKSPQENILVQPYDVISVPKSSVVYVIGEVKKTGGFVLGDRKETTVIEALAMAEGISPIAKTNKAEILRLIPGQEQRQRVSFNLKNILSGKEKDIAMLPEDILIIATNRAKAIKGKVADTAISVVTSMAIYGGLF